MRSTWPRSCSVGRSGRRADRRIRSSESRVRGRFAGNQGPLMVRRLAATAVVTVSVGFVLADAGAQLAGVQFVATEVADSQSYFVYRYELSNPAASVWSVASLGLDISANSGNPANLPATGDVHVIEPFPTGGAPHAEVGPITPPGWLAIMSPRADLTWTPPTSRSFSGDSIPPGTSKDGFGIRSTYLPGITTIDVSPTTESCCREPTDTTGGERIYAAPWDHALTTHTIVPRYIPGEVTLDLLQSQRTAVCTNPLWINDAPLCAEIADSLNAAEARLASGNNTGARTALDGVLAILGAEREPAGPIEDNAYWLLRMNTEHVLGSISGAGDVATGSATDGLTARVVPYSRYAANEGIP